MESYTNILLDGIDADLSADGYTFTWNTPQHYFKDIITDEDDIYISLYHCQYMGVVDPLKTWPITQTEILLTNQNLQNTTNTNKDNTIGMYDNIINATNKTVTGTRENHIRDMRFKIGKFNEISIKIRLQGDLLDFSALGNGVSQNFCKFYIQLRKVRNRDQKEFKQTQQKFYM